MDFYKVLLVVGILVFCGLMIWVILESLRLDKIMEYAGRIIGISKEILRQNGDGSINTPIEKFVEVVKSSRDFDQFKQRMLGTGLVMNLSQDTVHFSPYKGKPPIPELTWAEIFECLEGELRGR